MLQLTEYLIWSFFGQGNVSLTVYFILGHSVDYVQTDVV